MARRSSRVKPRAGSLTVCVAKPVEQAGFDAVERAAAWEVGEAHAHGVVGDGGYEARQTGDAVLVGVDDADAAQLDLGERSCRVDAHGGADGAEGALTRDSYASLVLSRRE